MSRWRPVRSSNKHGIFAWLLFVLGLYTGLPHRIVAQPVSASFVHRSWTTEDGLPQNSVTALARTQDGYLWIGTLQGLARFDGVRFTTFEAATAEGLVGNRIASLLEDQEGTLWIQTVSGQLSSYRAGRFIAHPDLGTVLGLYEDRRGTLWIGTKGGLVRREGSRTTRFTMADGLPGNRASVLLEDREGTLWIRTDGGLVQRTGGRFSKPAPPLDSAISALAEGADGSLWFKTERSIRHVSNQQVTDYPLSDVSIRRLIIDRSDRLWVLTNGQGLLRFTGENFVPFDEPAGLAGSVVHALLEDDTGLLWIGTRSSGLYQVQNRLFTAYDQGDGLPSNILHAVLEDRTGAMWVGTYDGGVARLTEDGQVDTYTVQDGLPNNAIYTISEDEEGTVWVTAAGAYIARFDGTRFVSPPSLPQQSTPTRAGIIIAFEASATLWWITSEGVFQRRNGTITRVLDQTFQALPEPLLEDHGGRLWLNHSGRLCRVEPAQLFCYDELAATQLIRTLYEVANDTYWLGTYGDGLCQLSNAAFSCLGKAHGLPDGTVHRILEDDFGYVWLSSNKGIVRIARQDLLDYFGGEIDRVYPDVYGMADGMPSNESNGGTYPAGWKARDGRLWFPTMKGLAVVDPSHALQQTNRPPPVHVEAVTVDGVPLSLLDAPTLPAGSDRLVFRYTAPYLRAPEKLRFRYRLQGHDTDWIEAGPARTATYTSLAPGSYRFLVETAIGSANWEEGAGLLFRMAPHFYQTAWFAGLVGLGLLLVSGLAYQARVRRLIERERLHRSEEEAVRLAELDAAKNRFFANISHEFRTPLTVILGATDQLEKTVASGEQTEPIRRNANRLLRLVNQLLDLSKLEAGNLKLDPQPIDLVDFLHSIVRSMQPLADRRRIDLHLRTEAERMEMLLDPDALEKVCNNLLSNALKFTSEGGKVWVTVERRTLDEGPVVEMIFKDTGPGIPQTVLPTIFDRFTQANTATMHEHEGTGIGLALAKELVALHGGKILVESELGFGSMFIVRLPLRSAVGEKVIVVDNSQRVGRDGEKRNQQPFVVDDREAPVIAEGSAFSPSKSSGTPKILLVEDNAEVRALVRRYLDDRYQIMEAADGVMGLRVAREHAPDLILSDVMMPRMDGFAFCRAVKSDETLRHIPVVLLTALAAEEETVEGLEAGADDYIAKPFSAAALRARIANLIASRQQLREQFSQEFIVQPAGVVVPSEEEAFLKDLLSVIEDQMGNITFGVDSLAAELGMSRRKLERRLKAATQQTPAELIRQVRLERAAQLLEAHNSTIAEVAFAVGYKSPSHFARAFRKAFGRSPSEHIEKAS